MRAIDFHVHLPTPAWLDVSMKGYIEAAEGYFRSKVVRRTIDELAADYEAIDVMAVLLAWDAETATGRPRVPNEVVAKACREHPKTFVGFGSVDPLKGDIAVGELDHIASLRLKGVKLHPSYPWHLELLAMALHKTNIYIDISGWAPKYIPSEVIREMKGRLQDQFVFGSDYPFIQPERCLDELATMEVPEAALHKVLTENGKKLLGLS